MRKILFSILIFFSKFSYSQIDCSSWLQTPANPSYVEIGQLNVTGDQITVEATINRTTSYSGGPLYAGDIVSKHKDPVDVNYLLRPNSAEIATSNGYYATPPVCEIELNKTYHVAMVYNGSSLKFYRNGFLMSQVAVTGNMIQNGWPTRIGYYYAQLFNTNFIGFINEVRIWNVARTQSELKAYMNTSLPNPTTQPGLLAYYTFNSLTNKQGNPSWNGTLGGSATINQFNTSCNFIADSCSIPISIDTIINNYTEVLGYDICKNELRVADATKYNPGDTVLIIQMKGAVIDSNNTSTFGNITNYNNSGNYEMNIVKQKNGNSLSLLNILQRQYDIPNGKVQLVRVPYYNNITLNSTLTCLPWDGSKGGILVLNVAGTTTLNADIDVSGKGFLGGRSPNPNTTTLYCNYNDYYYPFGTAAAADKGESIATIGNNIAWGKGSPANGGGGGNGHNSGGGGGSNGGAGGFGGYQLDACGGSATDNRGIGGKALIYNNGGNKIFMGGGGGSGQTDNAGGSPMNGGKGGGIIIIKSSIINSGGFKIAAKGGDAPQCNLSPIDLCHDASGGGGGGGTVLIENSSMVQPTTIDIRGGKGGDLIIYNPPGASKIGPGAGGGAGVCWTNYTTLPGNIVVDKTGGVNGVITPNGNDPYGTTPGDDGLNILNLKIPIDTILFKPNIDSVRLKDSIYNCSSVDFKGFGFTNTSPINNWKWSFGDGGTGTTQDVSHTYTTSGTYTVKLVVTDINGCKDSISKPITVSNLNITKSPDTTLCGSSPVQIFAAGGSTYSWIPTTGLSNPNISNPIATPVATTKYYVTITNAVGCSKMDSVKITVSSVPIVTKSNDTSVCKNSPVQLLAAGGSTYTWSPTAGLSNPNIANPIATPSATTKYYVTVTNAGGCSKKDSVTISIKNLPVVTKSNDTAVCINKKVQLLVSGGTTYSWSPASTLDNPNISNPVASPLVTTKYYVTVTNAAGCSKMDSITVKVNNLPVITKSNDAAICLNSQAQLSASGGLIYSWSPASSLDNPGISNPIAKPLVTTKYYVTVTNANGCSNLDSIQITVNSLPVISKSNDTLVCQGSPVPLFASGGTSYSWTPSATLNNSAIANPIATPINPTTYIVNVTNAAGCSKSDSVKINIKPVPVITKSNDTTICDNVSVKLFVAGGNSYVWSPASTLDDPTSATPVASPLASTIYRVRITDILSCTYNDSVKISVKAPPVFAVSPSNDVCKKSPQQLTASGGTSYTWTPASFLNNPTISNPVAMPDTTITYFVTITESTCNESATLFTTLTVLPLPDVQATSSNDITCTAPSSHLSATGALNYVWSPASNLNNASIANPTATPGTTTVYTVVGKDINGCADSDTVSVKVAFNINALYGLPNSFTPNGDGINDCFGVRYWGQVNELDFNIYNRFGQRVFHTNSSSVCWDGTYKGKRQDADIFVYTIKAKTACGLIDRKGTIALLR
jgi:gliding motility-associated-like protein